MAECGAHTGTSRSEAAIAQRQAPINTKGRSDEGRLGRGALMAFGESREQHGDKQKCWCTPAVGHDKGGDNDINDGTPVEEEVNGGIVHMIVCLCCAHSSRDPAQ